MSAPEDLLAFQLKAAKIEFIREYKAISGRDFRFDFACSPEGSGVRPIVLVEVHGGVWTGGRHTTGKGLTRDCEKMSLAATRGFRIIQATSEHVKSGQALQWIEQALRVRAGS